MRNMSIKELFKVLMDLLCKGPVFYQVNRKILRNRIPIFLQYNIQPKTRYGQGKPYGNGSRPHSKLCELIGKHKDRYRGNLHNILKYGKNVEGIPLYSDKTETEEPVWLNGYFPALDAITLYGFLGLNQPKIYLEIGSGYSTKVARKAIDDLDLDTRVISIDPAPRTEVSGICDKVIRIPLENVDPTIFDSLNANDILFIDSSHYVFPNSDVTAIFMDILPRLRPGVLVHFHDISLPFDYPNEQIKEYYSEQYILGAWILAEGNKFEIIQANTFVSNEPDLHKLTLPLWEKIGLDDHFVSGSSFWIKMR
jgi:predicted O-methyltransferase YrrM